MGLMQPGDEGIGHLQPGHLALAEMPLEPVEEEGEAVDFSDDADDGDSEDEDES